MNEWFILPGMGASSKMYDSFRQKINFHINFIDWPTYQNEKTFKDIANRVVSEYNIKGGDVIGGSSLGGMIALEVAMILPTKAVVLIGSALDKKEIQRLLSKLAPLASITPFTMLQTLAGQHQNLISQMFSDTNADFIKAMCKYVPSWPGYQGSLEQVYRIQGEKDHIIPCPSVGCEVIKKAGHLLAMTHVNGCVVFLEKIKQEIS